MHWVTCQEHQTVATVATMQSFQLIHDRTIRWHSKIRSFGHREKFCSHVHTFIYTIKPHTSMHKYTHKYIVPCPILSVQHPILVLVPSKIGRDKEQHYQTATSPVHTYMVYWQQLFPLHYPLGTYKDTNPKDQRVTIYPNTQLAEHKKASTQLWLEPQPNILYDHMLYMITWPHAVYHHMITK